MKQQVQAVFAEIVKKLGIVDAEIVVDFPESALHGEYTTNIAMVLSKRLKAPPREIAQKIIEEIKIYQTTSDGEWIDRVEIAGPGFINLYVTNACFGSVIDSVLKEKESYGTIQFSIFNLQFSKNGRKLSKAEEINTSENKSGKNEQKNVDKMGKTITTSVDSAGKESSSASTALRGKRSSLVNENLDVSSDSLMESSHSVSAGLTPSQGEDTQNFVPSLRGSKTFVVEFAHPNTHKAFHIGHLRNITTGETIVRLLESQGNKVIRANYQGDVGMHIAKALYALLELSPFKEDVDKMTGINNRVEFLGKAYAAGSKAFEEDEKAKGIIKDLNALIYASAQKYAHEVGRNPGTTDYLKLVANHVHPLEKVYALWKETRQWSLDYFDTVYTRVHTTYDRKFFESECLSGVDTAKDAVKKNILEDSEGAIIFRGEQYGLDTRVFVNSLGLPTYEAKELALAPMEATEFGEVDRIIHCVGPEQASFFKVTFKVEELLGFVKPGVQHHLAYGWVKLKHGKMSSRTGNVVLGEWLIDEVKQAILEIMDSNTSKQIDIDKDSVAEALAIGAIKYAFLKVSTNQEIAFDLKESINTNGDSGPYLMYTYARAKSVMRKADSVVIARSESSSDADPIRGTSQFNGLEMTLNEDERLVARMILQFPDIVKAAADNYAPNTLCTYLFQLAQAFNVFYGKNPIVGENHRLALTSATAQVLKNGLYLLGINVLERM